MIPVIFLAISLVPVPGHKRSCECILPHDGRDSCHGGRGRSCILRMRNSGPRRDLRLLVCHWLARWGQVNRHVLRLSLLRHILQRRQRHGLCCRVRLPKRRIPLLEDARRIPDWWLRIVADDTLKNVGCLRRGRDGMHVLNREACVAMILEGTEAGIRLALVPMAKRRLKPGRILARRSQCLGRHCLLHLIPAHWMLDRCVRAAAHRGWGRLALYRRTAQTKGWLQLERLISVQAEWRTKLQYQVDGEGLTKIKGQLEDLAEQVKREGAEMRFLEESVMAMERVNIELRKAVEGLRVEFAAKVEEPKKPAQPEALPSVETETAGKRPALASVQTNEEGTLTSEEPSPKKKKKSHKWAGGGADRDIIAQGTQLELTPRTQQQATPRSQAAASAAKRLGGRTAPKAALKPAKKTSATAPAPKQSQKPPAKAAPKPQQRMTANMPARKAARTPAPKLSSSKKSSTHLTESERRVNGEVVPGLRDKSIPDVPILRSGKGWFVVSMTEEEEQEWKEKDRQRFKTINDEVKAKKAAKYGEVEGRAQAMAGVDEDDEV